MKNRIFFLLLFFSGTITAQRDMGRITGYDFHSTEDAPVVSQSRVNEFVLIKRIASKTTVRRVGRFKSTRIENYNQKGYLISSVYESSDGWKSLASYTYDDEGYLTSRVVVGKKGLVTLEELYTYDASHRLIKRVEKRKNKTLEWEFGYDQNGNRILSSGYDRKGRYYLRKKIYDLNTNRLLVSEIYDKDRVSVLKKLVYEYYEREKLVYTWNFDCLPEGERVDLKKKEETMVCQKREWDENGHEVIWHEEFNADGTILKTKSILDAEGKVLEKTSYRADGTLHTVQTYFADGGYLSMGYDKKGKLIGTSEEIYNTNGQLVKSHASYKRYENNKWYSYNNDLPTLEAEITKRWSIIEEYSYTFFE